MAAMEPLGPPTAKKYQAGLLTRAVDYVDIVLTTQSTQTRRTRDAATQYRPGAPPGAVPASRQHRRRAAGRGVAEDRVAGHERRAARAGGRPAAGARGGPRARLPAQQRRPGAELRA